MRLLLTLTVFVSAVNTVDGFDLDDYCLNGGEVYHGQCGCPSYFNGTKCEWPVCTNNGTLNADGKACTCPQGYTGAACQFPSCKENSNATVLNDYKPFFLMVEVSAATKDALNSLADNIEKIFTNAGATHKDWLGSIIVYAMKVDGTIRTQQFSLSTQAATYLKALANEATEAGQCTMPIWESLNDLFVTYSYTDRSQLVLITAAIPQVNGTDFAYGMNHFTTEAPTFDFIHVESDACPMMRFKQNYTEFVNFVVSFNGIFLRSAQADVGKTLQTLLPTRYVAQRISIEPHLPDINCTSDSISVLVDSQTTHVYITVAGNGATAVVRDASNNVVATSEAVKSAVQMVWHFTPAAPGNYKVTISSKDDLCFPVVYSDGIQVVLAFSEYSNTDSVLSYPLPVVRNFPVVQQYGRGDVLSTLDYIYSRRYPIDPPTWWIVFLQSTLSPHLNCAYNWIGEDFDRQTDQLATFTIQGTDKNGHKFERSISARSHSYNGPTTSTTQSWTTNSTAPMAPTTQGPSQPTIPNVSSNNTSIAIHSTSITSTLRTVPTTMPSAATATLIPTTGQPTTAFRSTLSPSTVAPASSTEAFPSTTLQTTIASSTLVSIAGVVTNATSTIKTSTTSQVLVNAASSIAATSTVPTSTTNSNNTTSMESTSTATPLVTNNTSVLPDGTTASPSETTTKSSTVSTVLLATVLTAVKKRFLL